MKSNSIDSILKVLSKHLSNVESSRFKTALNTMPNRLYSVRMLYRYKQAPYGALGPCEVLPQFCRNLVWIFCHTLIKDSLIKTLRNVIKLYKIEETEVFDYSNSLWTLRVSGIASDRVVNECFLNMINREKTNKHVIKLLESGLNNIPSGVNMLIRFKMKTEMHETNRAITPSNEANSIEGLYGELSEILADEMSAFIVKRSYLDGWDIVLKSRSALSSSLWNSLVFSETLQGGVENEHLAATFKGTPYFPMDFPDTEAGQSFWNRSVEKILQKVEKLPLSKLGKSQKTFIENGISPRWENLLRASSEEDTLYVDYYNDSPTKLQNAVRLLMILVTPCHTQPKGVKSRLEIGARIFFTDEACYTKWRASPKEWSFENFKSSPICIGFVTSTTYNQRTTIQGRVHGIGFIRVDDFSRKQLSRLMRARDVFVAMKNPSAEIKSPYLAGFLKLLYTEKLIGDK